MPMPGAFPADSHDFDSDSTPWVYELPTSAPPEDAGTPLSFKASPVEWQLPLDSSLVETENSHTNTSNQQTNANKRRTNSTSRSSGSTKPFAAIAVFGVTGTGKSTFISTLTGKQVGIGHGLKSCTTEIQEVPYSLGLCNVLLVDTPGFDDTHRTDTDILREIAGWMEHAYDDKIPLTGVIYLHRISDVRMSGASYKNLKMLRSLCGRESLSNVILASTMWDKVTLEEGEQREKELLDEGNFWGQLKQLGAKEWRYDNTPSTAIAMVNYLLQKDPVILQIQRELAVEKKSLIDTSAGRSISLQLDGLKKKFADDIALVRRDLTQAQREDDHRHRRELEQLRKNLEKKQQEVEESRRKLLMPINIRSKWLRIWRCKNCGVRLKKVGSGVAGEKPCPGCGYWQKFI